MEAMEACRNNQLRAAAKLVNAIRVAIEHLENGQGAASFGQCARHLVGRRERHKGVEAGVVLPGEGTRVGERAGGGKRAQIRATSQLLDEEGLQLRQRRLLHQRNERLKFPKGRKINSLLREYGAEPQFRCE